MVARFIVPLLLAFGGCQRKGEQPPKASRTEAKKKAVKPLAINRSIRRTAQPALAEGPLKVRRPMLAAERYLRAMRKQTEPPRRAPLPFLTPYLRGAVLRNYLKTCNLQSRRYQSNAHAS